MIRICACLLLLLSQGCSYLGAKSILEDPTMVPDNVAMCQMVEGDIVIDGIYSNSQGSAISLIEVNGGCANVRLLEMPQKSIQLNQ